MFVVVYQAVHFGACWIHKTTISWSVRFVLRFRVSITYTTKVKFSVFFLFNSCYVL